MFYRVLSCFTVHLWLVKQPFICHNYVSILQFIQASYTFPARKIGSVDFDGSADITLDQIGCDYVVEDTIDRKSVV